MSPRNAACLLGAVLALSACGHADNDLWGSIDESFSLEFDRVEIARFSTNLWLRIQYLKDLPAGVDKVCKVSIDTDGMRLDANSEIAGDIFLSRVTVERIAAAGGALPEVRAGTVLFDEFDFDPGGRISGEFTVEFANGRNLMGNFNRKLKLVDSE